MQFEIKTENLREALNKVLNVIDKKITRQLLTNCLITSTSEGVELLATDLEVSVRVIIPCQVESPASFCINTKYFSDIVRELPSEEIVTLSYFPGENNLRIACKKIQFDLATISSEEYPHLSFEGHNEFFEVSAQSFLHMIQKISHAISTDETRLFLNGIFLQTLNSQLRGVAVDGYRLALVDIPDFNYQVDDLVDGVIIPKKGVTEIKRLAETYKEENLQCCVDENFIYFRHEDNYFISIRLIPREFPKYQAHIPSKTTYALRVDKSTFSDAIRRTRILANEKTHGIKLELKDNQATITANNAVFGHASEQIDVNYEGTELRIGFNAKYVLDTLSSIEDEEIIFEFNNELSPVLVKSEQMPEFLGILMPLKL